MRPIPLLALTALALLLLGVGFFLVRSGGHAGLRERLSHETTTDAEPVAPLPVTGSEKSVALGPKPALESRPGVRQADAAAQAQVAIAGSLVITGKVIDLANASVPGEARVPAEGAQVSIREGAWGLNALGYSGEEAESKPGPQTADHEGRFRFVLDDPGTRPFRVELLVEANETHRHASDHVTFAEGESVAELIIERRAMGTVFGVTIDALREPVSGVEVRLPNEDPSPVATSDEEGRFRFDVPTKSSEMLVEKAGYVVLEASAPRLREDGSWDPAEIILAPRGSLVVVLQDAEGTPLPGRHITPFVSSAEPGGAALGRRFNFGDPNRILAQPTGEDGVTRFPRIWAQTRMNLSVNNLPSTFERMRRVDGRAHATIAEGEPIVIEPGRELELIITLPGVFRVSGQVLGADGAPAAGASVRLCTIDTPRHAPSYVSATAQAGDEGDFALELFSETEFERVRLTATDGGDPYSFTWGPDDDIDGCWLDFAREDSPVEGVLLRLEPTSAIAGRLVDDNGEGLRGQVSARLTGAGLGEDISPIGVRQTTYARKDGSFRLIGLTPGSYDVEASTSGWKRTIVSDVAAGKEDLVVTLGSTRPVRVLVDVDSSVELEQIIVLTGSLLAFGEFAGEPASLRSKAYAEPSGWPAAMVGLWYGAGGHTSELGRMSFSLIPKEPADFPFEVMLDEGLGWIGLKARTVDGARTFPVGTGLVRFEEGSFELSFEQAPGSELTGRVEGVPAGADWYAGIVGANGELLVLDVRRKSMQDMGAIGANGSFAFPLVPEGEFELRIGTKEELRAGRWSLREPFQAQGGKPLRLELAR